jgi:hypothetical protein
MNDAKTEQTFITKAAAAARTIPNAKKAFGTSTINFASVTGEVGGNETPVDLRGCYVMVQNASGGDLTLLRGASGMSAPAAGFGKIIKDGTTEEFYVDPTDDDHYAKGSATGLTLLFDTKLAKGA